MRTMADAVDWQAIPAGVDAVAGYVDGPRSAWPPEAWAHFAGRPVLRVTVLADDHVLAFDSEPGNAGVDAVAVAVRLRANRGEPSVVYTDHANMNGLTEALGLKSLRWLPASSWPAAGPYLWAAAPGTTPGQVPPWCPVRPVAVQDRWDQTYDLSTLYGGWQPPVEPSPDHAPAPTYEPAPALAPRTGEPRAYVPVATVAEALDLLRRGVLVYLWTVAHGRPVPVPTTFELVALQGTTTPPEGRWAMFAETD